MTASTQEKLTLRPGIDGVVHSRNNASLFSTVRTWWVEWEGKPCCADLPYEKRHIERYDAIQHGRELCRQGRWVAE